MKTIIIIGGDAAGMSVASKLKRTLKNVVIIVLEQTGETSYGACGLPYYIGGENPSSDLIRIRKPEKFIESGIDVRLFHKVVSVEVIEKKVTAINLQTGDQISLSYDQLVVASGAAPVMPKFEGNDLKGVHTLKSIQDAEAICEESLGETTKNVVIVGAGYIGLELAEAFYNRGLSLRLIEALDRPMRNMDTEFSDMLVDSLEEKGIRLNLNEKVTAFSGDKSVKVVITDKGEYPAELVIVSVGVKPATSFLEGTGIDMLPNGAIVVDEQMRSSIPDIFAAGDCATIINKLTGEKVYLPFGTNANKQGKILGEVLSGKDSRLTGVLGTSICRVIDLEFARTGLNMADAKRAGIPAAYVLTDAMNCPPYYPKYHCQLRVKLFYNTETREVIGIQMAGAHGAASRAGACAAVVDSKMTCQRLAMLDMGYSPPVTSVWDPIQVAASMVK